MDDCLFKAFLKAHQKYECNGNGNGNTPIETSVKDEGRSSAVVYGPL